MESAPRPPGEPAPDPERSIQAFMLSKPSASAQRQYPPVLREFLRLALMKQPGLSWEDSTLGSGYLSHLDAAGPKRAQAMARDLQRYVDTMLVRLRARTLTWATVSWHYGVAKEFAEYMAGEGLTSYDSRAIRKSFRAYKLPAKVREGLSPAQLREILRWPGADAKTFYMVMKSSGGRPEEVGALTVYDVEAAAEPWGVFFGRHKPTGAKEGGERKSYVDRETRPYVQALMDSGDHSADPRLFGALGPDLGAVLRQVRREWRRSLARVGLPYAVPDSTRAAGPNGKQRLKVVRPLYLLRSFFKTKGGSKYGFGREVAEVLMGHHGDTTEEAYQNFGLGELRELYAQGESALWVESLFEEGERARGRAPDQPAPTRP